MDGAASQGDNGTDSGEELSAELEALRYTYEVEIEPPSQPEGPVQLLTGIHPYMGLTDGSSSLGAVFVQLKLQLLVPERYPQTLPGISLLEVRGLGDVRQQELLQLLKSEAAGLQGTMMLGHLIETANAYVTDNNHPEGDCAFCLEPLCTAAHGSGHTTHLVKLPCFHAFHRSCYCSWWSWQQQETAQKELELVRHTGSRATLTLLADKLPPRESEPYAHLFTTNCPVCRTPCPLSSIAHLIPDLTGALAWQKAAAEKSRDKGSTETAVTASSGVVLVNVLAGQLQALQLRNQRIFKQQQAAGGIISAEAPSCSLSHVASSSQSGSDVPGQAAASSLAAQEEGCTHHSYQQSGRASRSGRLDVRTAQSTGLQDEQTSASHVLLASGSQHQKHQVHHSSSHKPDARRPLHPEQPPYGLQSHGTQGSGLGDPRGRGTGRGCEGGGRAGSGVHGRGARQNTGKEGSCYGGGQRMGGGLKEGRQVRGKGRGRQEGEQQHDKYGHATNKPHNGCGAIGTMQPSGSRPHWELREGHN